MRLKARQVPRVETVDCLGCYNVAGGPSVSDDQLLARITSDPRVMTGKPVIAGTRLTVEYILNLLAHGASYDEIKSEYDRLTDDDIAACLLYASRSLAESA
jgi:uncharacterized protein (DUF433 family)